MPGLAWRYLGRHDDDNVLMFEMGYMIDELQNMFDVRDMCAAAPDDIKWDKKWQGGLKMAQYMGIVRFREL